MKLAKIDLDVEKNVLRMCIETDDLSEVSLLMNSVTRLKAPAVGFGGVTSTSCWAWFHLPIKKGFVNYVPFRGGKE